MTDDRIFATSKGAVDSNGNKIIPMEDSPVESWVQEKKRNLRPALYVIYVPLLILDWAATLLANITEIIANSIKTLALSLETYIDADTKSAVPEETE